MNITLREVYQTNPDGDRFWKLKECYIRGSTVRRSILVSPLQRFIVGIDKVPAGARYTIGFRERGASASEGIRERSWRAQHWFQRCIFTVFIWFGRVLIFWCYQDGVFPQEVRSLPITIAATWLTFLTGRGGMRGGPVRGGRGGRGRGVWPLWGDRLLSSHLAECSGSWRMHNSLILLDWILVIS
jgi:hypothetical protein